MIGLTHFICYLLGILTVILAYIGSEYFYNEFQIWLESRRRQSKKKYKIIKKKGGE